MNFLSKLRSKINRVHGVVLTLLFFTGFVLIYIGFKLFVIEADENSISYTNNNFNVLDLSIPARLDFCGEVIPTDDYDIKLALKKEFFNQSYWKSNSYVLFNKAQRWFPYITPILKQEGIPDDFKYLAVIESHLSNVRSSAGAAGFWQLVAGSAVNYGLEVNEWVDERFHVEKATRAACLHIKEAYGVFKNWTLSAAAYNRGINGILAAMKTQKSDNYHDLLLNKETGSFVYRILAYKTLLSSPAHFGIKKKKWTYFPKIQYKVFKVDSSIHNLSSFAKHLGVEKSLIKWHNPWLLSDELINTTNKVYEIRIPKNLSMDYSSYLNDLAVEQIEMAEGIQLVADSLSAEEMKEDKTLTKVFIDQETSIEDLAKTYSVTTDELRKWNHLKLDQKSIKSFTLNIQNPEIKSK